MVIAIVSTLAAVIPVAANEMPAFEPSVNTRFTKSVTPEVKAALPNV